MDHPVEEMLSDSIKPLNSLFKKMTISIQFYNFYYQKNSIYYRTIIYHFYTEDVVVHIVNTTTINLTYFLKVYNFETNKFSNIKEKEYFFLIKYLPGSKVQ